MGQSRPLIDKMFDLRAEVERWQKVAHQRATEIAALYQKIHELERERSELRGEVERHSRMSLARAAEIVRLRERIMELTAPPPPPVQGPGCD